MKGSQTIHGLCEGTSRDWLQVHVDPHIKRGLERQPSFHASFKLFADASRLLITALPSPRYCAGNRWLALILLLGKIDTSCSP